MEVDSMVIIAILSMSYITTRIVKTKTSVAKIPRVPVENQTTTLSVVKIAIKFSSCKKFTTETSEMIRGFLHMSIVYALYSTFHRNLVKQQCTLKAKD